MRDVSSQAVAFLLKTKSAQLQRQYSDQSLEKPWIRSFIQNLHKQQKPNSFSVLSTLRAGGQLVAAHLGMVAGNRCGGVFSSWIPVVNPQFGRYSPGTILMWEIIQAAEAQGIEQIELGRGENQLKRRFANKTEPMGIGRFGSTLKWNAVSKVEGWLRLAKKNIPKLQSLPSDSFRSIFRSSEQ